MRQRDGSYHCESLFFAIIYFFLLACLYLRSCAFLFVVSFSCSSLVGSFTGFNVAPLSPVHRVSSPQLVAFQQELAHHPDRAKVQYVLDGIAHGFSLGFDPSRVALRSSLRNMRSATDHPHVIDEYLATEIAKSRVAGPFATPPFPNLHCSPFGVIPKKGQPGKWRIILDLSSPTQHSVNDGIPKDLLLRCSFFLASSSIPSLRRLAYPTTS